jgi:DNA-binding IclR family transcriptional regulator
MSADPLQVGSESGAAPRGTQTAKKALLLLRLVIGADDAIGLADLARLSGINKASAHRLLGLLEDEALIQRLPHGSRYVPGASMIALSAIVLGKVDIRREARPSLARLAEAAAETVTLYVRNGLFRVCIDTIESSYPIRRVVPLGRVRPLWAGPTGTLMTAFLDGADLEAVLAAAKQDGENGCPSTAELDGIRERGYVMSSSLNGGSLSVPIVLGDGQVAAISISGPANRFNETTMPPLVEVALEEAAALSEILKGVAVSPASARVR